MDEPVTAAVEFRLLSGVEATMAGRPLDLGPPRQRIVLAVLLLEVGRAVPVNRLIHRVWDEAATGQPRQVLYSYISRLRRVPGNAPRRRSSSRAGPVPGGCRASPTGRSASSPRSPVTTARRRVTSRRRSTCSRRSATRPVRRRACWAWAISPRRSGEYRRALDHQRQALAILVEVGHRSDQAHALLRIGQTALAMDEPAQAREHVTRALDLNRQLDNRAGIAFSLMGLGDVLLGSGEPVEAAEKYLRAATDLTDLGYPRGQAEARLGLGRALAATGDRSRAREQLEQALALFEKIESPQAAGAREALRHLPA